MRILDISSILYLTVLVLWPYKCWRDDWNEEIDYRRGTRAPVESIRGIYKRSQAKALMHRLKQCLRRTFKVPLLLCTQHTYVKSP